MSDRIDELVAAVRCETSGYTADGDYFCHDSDAALDELATIAREADARALIWQLTTENTQKLLNEAIARAIEKEQKYREAAAAIAAVEQEEAE